MNPMQIQAIVLPDYGEEIQLQTVTLDPPRDHEVRVRIKASGVCHTDWHVVTGHLPLPVPMVLGHEGAGVVEALGEGVTRVKVGDRVVIGWVAACGQCFWCREGQPELCEAANQGAVDGVMADQSTRLHDGAVTLHPFSNTGTLAEAVVVLDTALTAIPANMPWEEAALLGCAVQTGTGAAFHAPITPGCSVAVIGCGGVGLNIIQGARIRGAARIFAIDPSEANRDLAQVLGATDTIDPQADDPLLSVLDFTQDRGVDVAFEAVGSPDTMAQAYAMIRRGGTAVVVGVPSPNAEVTLNAFAFPSQEKTLTGSWYGGASLPRDIPRLVHLWESGQLRLAPLIRRRYTLAQVSTALMDMVSGQGGRGVVLIHGADDASPALSDERNESEETNHGGI